MIEILYNGGEFLDIVTEDNMENILKLNATDIQRKTIWWSISKLSCNEVNEAIENIYKRPFMASLIAEIEDEFESNELSFFRHSSSNFATINLDNFQIFSTVTLPTQESIHGYTGSCILPDKTYFYCCNNNSSSGTTFTIDKNKNLKQLQNSKINYHVNPIFFNNYVYLIGGNNNLAERYDFKQNVWESMAPLPQGLSFQYSSNARFRDSIFITSHSLQKVIVYSIPQNNY
ncbi:unnamed protein product [Blepharisma stoltei]|uniref:Kelch-like protein n=1 Tax=Blepharisma stoltei TaxID=1481888 RepID=A0AAU9IQC2_9CILI|nr:unnamed protein product [Blepharisma stoltei]